ncbi:DUF3857 domain-containing protein [Pedobacter montanisoli]|uniref:DUF2569 family protein n=1 Tax=Pedobacter montanisoli TaxID=2923277 RepID=A0ABS9ZY56_9SPHI|nr:DUF3857 domain-containing protein [Pedobacter montanisoli]MCJ0743261.1 DUF2569 family protein [Pedobacter montanisoli]
MLTAKNEKFILIILFLCCFLPVKGQHKNFSISASEPNWLQKQIVKDIKPAEKDIQDGYYLSAYENQQNLETQEQYQRTIRNIVSDNGVQNASEISVTFDPSYQELVFHKIIVWRNNKPINKLVHNNFKVVKNEKELAKFIYSGTFDAYIILDDIRKNDKIEYSYTIKGHNPVFGKAFSTVIYFEGNSQLSNLYYNVIFNKQRKINLKNFNKVPNLITREANNLKIYEWKQDLTQTIKANDFEPSWYNPYGRTQISEFNTWKEVVDWALKLHEYNISKSPILNTKIADLKKKANGDLIQYLTLATRFVQDEIRYMGVEIGEYSHRPNSPERVLKQRYGDCKDKSLLLVALLKANGITAYPVFINTYNGIKLNELLPSPSVFNHQITLVELSGKKIWIDATVTDQGGSILENYFPYSANVLVIKPGNDKLDLVTENPKGQLKIESVFHVADTIAGSKTKLIIKSVYSDNYAESLRNEINSTGISKLSKAYLDYYAKTYPGITISKDLEITDNRQNNIISLTEYYEIEDIWQTDSLKNRIAVKFYADMIEGELRELNKARNVPFALKYPSNIHQIFKIVLPEWTIKDEKESYKRNAYQFDYSIKYASDTLTLDYKYQNFKPELTAGETNQYVKDKNAILENVSYEIFWNKKIEKQVTSGINSWAVVIFLFSLLIGGFISYYLYTRKGDHDIEKIKFARSINGWLILAAIIVVISPFTLMFSFFKMGHFENSTWSNFSRFDDITQFLFKLMLSGEILFNSLLIVYSVFLIFLFFNRRDILPKHFIIFRIAVIIAPILDVFFIYLIYEQAKLEFKLIDFTGDISAIIRSTIFSCIWIIYFIKSSRVKETFVFTYPKSNWAYELAEINLKENLIRFESENQSHIMPDKTNTENNENI